MSKLHAIQHASPSQADTFLGSSASSGISISSCLMWLVKAALMSPDTQPACLKSLAALVTYTVSNKDIVLYVYLMP